MKLEDLPSLFDRFSLCRLPPPAATAPDAAGRPATPKSKAQSCGCDSCAAGASAGACGGACDLSTRASLPAQLGAVHEHCCWLDAPRGGPAHHPLWPSVSTAKRDLARSSAQAAGHRTRDPPTCSGHTPRLLRATFEAREERPRRLGAEERLRLRLRRFGA